MTFLQRTQLFPSVISCKATTWPGGDPHNCHYPEEEDLGLHVFLVPYKDLTVTNCMQKLWATSKTLCDFGHSGDIALIGDVLFLSSFLLSSPALLPTTNFCLSCFCSLTLREVIFSEASFNAAIFLGVQAI